VINDCACSSNRDSACACLHGMPAFPLTTCTLLASILDEEIVVRWSIQVDMRIRMAVQGHT
jgi:hypothetical protein